MLTLRTLILSLAAVAFALPQAPTAGKCWKSLAPLRSARQEHSTAVLGDSIYVIGGMKGLGPNNAVDIYSVKGDAWSSGPALPTALHHPNVATVDGKIYVLGGITSPAGNSIGWTGSGKSYVLENGKWSPLADLPNGRGSAAMGVYDKKIYLAGGLAVMGKAANGVDVFDTSSGKWSTVSTLNLPESRDHGAGVVIGSTYYVIGGRGGDIANLRTTSLSADLSSPSPKWTILPKMPQSVGGIAAAAVDSKIYVFGGEGNPATGTRGVFSNVQVFDTAAKTWATEPPMKNPRHGTSAVAIGETIYVPGGGVAQGGNNPTTVSESYGAC